MALALVAQATDVGDSFVALGDRQIERARNELDPVFRSPPRDG